MHVIDVLTDHYSRSDLSCRSLPEETKTENFLAIQPAESEVSHYSGQNGSG